MTTVAAPPISADPTADIAGSGVLPAEALPSWPIHDDTERRALLRALDQDGWWRVAGRENEAFEAEFADFNGAPYALTVTNGTAALSLALRVHGIGPGDEVIVPAFTFISTSLAVQNLGATPVVVDVDPGSMCLTVPAVEAALTPRTRAVIPVHMAGHVAATRELEELGERHGFVVIQDAAHAPGARRAATAVGGSASIACYSFQNGKLMTAGEGGAVTFPDEATYERGYLMHTCGRPVGDVSYQHLTGGENLRLNEFSAAVLRAQLVRLRAQLPVRERNARLLDQHFAGVDGVGVQRIDAAVEINPHYMYLLQLTGEVPGAAGDSGARQRDEIVDALKRRGVPVCRNFPPVYRTASFWAGPTGSASEAELAQRCPVAEDIGNRGLWLHHRALLADADTLHRLADIVADEVARAARAGRTR